MLPGRPLFLPGTSARPSALVCKSGGTSTGSTTPSGQGINPWLKAGLTSGSFSLLGDLLAQLLPQRRQLGKAGYKPRIDYHRLLRMGSFGLLFYGPYQHKWYGALDSRWPSRGWNNFLTKVTLNQIALSPVVLAVVFSWNLALTGQSDRIGAKIKADLVTTMINGWKFWVPAASINFAVIPLSSQVLYMSVCSVLWTAYLSHASNAQPQLQLKATS